MLEYIENLPFWLQASAIFLSCMIKSYTGPILSILVGMKFWHLVIIQVIATITSISLSYRFRDFILKFFFRSKNKSGFNPKLKKTLKLWNKYGFWGTVLVSPVLIGIPTGVILSAHFKTKKRILFIAMTVSSFIWMNVFYWTSKFGISLF